MKSKLPYLSILIILPLSLLALGCSKGADNSLTRPNAEANTNSASDSSGEVAGAEIFQLPTKTIQVGNVKVEVELPASDAETSRGLSGRTKLDDNNGMLFNFTNADFNKPGFWMKDMLISIDIIWIDADGKIIGIEANVPLPNGDKDLTIYYPPSPIGYVLEVPAGWSAKNNVTLGTQVKL